MNLCISACLGYSVSKSESESESKSESESVFLSPPERARNGSQVVFMYACVCMYL